MDTSPVIDLQSFRAAITAQIEKVAKDHRHRFEVPLAEVVAYAGIGAARAARQWNDISHKENHVATEWFQNCVCNLVSGVVNDIGQMAFEDQGMNACMYLEPDDYDPFDVPSYTAAAPVSSSSHYIPRLTDDYYGFQQTEIEKDDGVSPTFTAFSGSSHTVSAASQPIILRHEIDKGYTALGKLAASQKDASARAEFIQTTKHLRDDSEPTYDGSSPETLLKRPAKRSRPDSSSSGPSSGRAGSMNDNATNGPRKFFWTEEEVNILVTGREFGRDWHEIANMLPRHTNAACQTKYRLVKNKEVRHNPRTAVLSDQSQSDEDQVVTDSAEASRSLHNEDKTASSDPTMLSGFKAANMEIGNQDKPSSGDESTAATVGSPGEETQEFDLGISTEDPTVGNKE